MDVSFTEKHVEIIWHRSQLTRTKTFKMVASKDRQEPNFVKFLEYFKEQVEAGRADGTLKLDPRSCGNGRSAINLVEEVIEIFPSYVDSKDRLEALMAEPAVQG